MDSILESISWGKAAIRLAKNVDTLEPNIPAIMHIRHSERNPIESEEGLHMQLTETGITTSYEFGKNLPVNRKYKFYHTRVDRCRNTAENIQKGILENNGVSTITENIVIPLVRDVPEYRRVLLDEHKGDEEETARKVIFQWVLGLIPPSVLKPSLEFAKEAANLMLEHLVLAEPNDLVVWVTHDMFIAPFLLHWLGEYSWEKIFLLDGFILQLYEDYMMLFFREKKKKVNYPYWWEL